MPILNGSSRARVSELYNASAFHSLSALVWAEEQLHYDENSCWSRPNDILTPQFTLEKIATGQAYRPARQCGYHSLS